METTLGIIMQLLVLLCQIVVCALTIQLTMRKAGASEPAQELPQEQPLSEEEQQLQKKMQQMMDGMNNILGYDGHRQGDGR